MARITDPVLDWTADPLVQDQSPGDLYRAARVNKLYEALDDINAILNGATLVTAFDAAEIFVNGVPITGFGGFPSAGLPADVGTAALGVAATASRSDHVHAHGNQLGGTLHAVAGASAGFMSAADKAKLDGISAGASILGSGTAGRLARFSAGDTIGASQVADDGSGNLSGIGTVACGAITSSGDVTLNGASPQLVLGDGTGSPLARYVKSDAGTFGHQYYITTLANANRRWISRFFTDESLQWERYTDPGAGTTETVFRLSYTDGSATFANAVTVGANVTLSSASPTATIGNGTGAPSILIHKTAASNADLGWRVDGFHRFTQRLNATNQQFFFISRDAAGAVTGTTIVDPAAGAWTFPAAITVNGQIRGTLAGNAAVLGTTGSIGAVTPNVGGTIDDVVQLGTVTGGRSLAYQLFAGEGSRNTRVGFFLADDVSGSGAWGHWLTWSSGGLQPYVIGMGGSEMFRIANGAGDTGILGDLVLGSAPGTAAPAGSRLYVTGENGQILLADVTTDATQKVGRLAVQHATNAELPFGMLRGVSSAGSNVLNLGGSNAGLNAATQISLWTGAGSTTPTGTERMRIDAAGLTTLFGDFTLSGAGPIFRFGSGTGSPVEVDSKSDAGTFDRSFRSGGTGSTNARWIERFGGDESLSWRRLDASGGDVDVPLSLDWTSGAVTIGELASAPTPGAGRGSFYPRSSDGAPMYAYGATPTVSELVTVDASGVSTQNGVETIAANVQTTDGSGDIVATYTLADDQLVTVDAIVSAIQSDGSARAAWQVSATFYRDGAGAVQLGTNTYYVSKDPGATGWLPVIAASGNDVNVALVGAAATTVNWRTKVTFVPT